MNAVVAEARTMMHSPLQMLQTAIDQGADPEKMRQLWELGEKWEASQARKAFVSAMSMFKAEPARILKSKQVNIPGGAKFSHATLADVCDGVVSNLSKYGLSHRWETAQLENGWVEVTCIMTHQDGHSERTTLRAPPDDSGKKNTIQQIASTVTYLERYTLMAATGLASKDMDDDGRGASAPKATVKDPENYEQWQADMRALAEEGLERLTTVWKATDMSLRSHTIKHHGAWWEETKALAKKVQP